MAKITPRIQRIAQRSAGIRGAIGASRAKVQGRINLENRLIAEREEIGKLLSAGTELATVGLQTKEDYDLYKEGGGTGGIFQFLKNPSESALFIERGKELISKSFQENQMPNNDNLLFNAIPLAESDNSLANQQRMGIIDRLKQGTSVFGNMFSRLRDD